MLIHCHDACRDGHHDFSCFKQQGVKSDIL